MRILSHQIATWMLFIIGFTTLGLQPVRAAIWITEPFDYSDGPLTAAINSLWETSSGSEGQIQVVNNRVLIRDDDTEDVNHPLPEGATIEDAQQTLFAAFDLTVNAPPRGNGNYFAHFRGSTSATFRGRIFLLSDDSSEGSETIRLGITSGASLTSEASKIAQPLELQQTYRIVLQYNAATTETRLWVNPSSIDSDSTTSSDTPTARNITGFSFRQSLSSGNGIGNLTIDNLIIASTFAEANHATEPTEPTEPSEPSEPQVIVPMVNLIFPTNPTIPENDGGLGIELARTGGLDEQLEISVEVQTDTDSRHRFQLSDNVVFFPPGVAETSLEIEVIDNTLPDGDTNVTLSFSSENSSALIHPREFTIQIIDDDRKGVLIQDGFNYVDGPLSLNPLWHTHSGAAGTTLIENGTLILSDDSTEDMNIPIPGHPYTSSENLNLYAAFNLALLEPLPPTGTYFAHFKGTSRTAFRDRIFIQPINDEGTNYQIGLQSGSLEPATYAAKPLNIFTPYRIVVRYELKTGAGQLWINPKNEADLSIHNPTEGPQSAIESFAFRQTGSRSGGIGRLQIDELRIGTSFPDVTPTTELRPSVTLTAPVTSIKESDESSLIWLLHRTGDVSGELTVTATLEGSAQPLNDFNIIFTPQEISFAAGQRTLELRLYPVDDEEPEPEETVALTLQPNPIYQLEGEPSVSITFVDDDTPNSIEPLRISLHQNQISGVLPDGKAYFLETSEDLTRWTREIRIVPKNGAFEYPLETDRGSIRFFRLIAEEED